MKFNYQARTKKGEVQSGTIEASSREAALVLLQKYGLYVTLLEAVGAVPVYARKIKIFEKTSRKDIVLFSRQLSLLFKSKVPLVEAIQVLSGQTKNLDLKEKIIELSEAVEGGTSFSVALSRYPQIFSSFYVSMVRAGETSGKLSESLEYLADHLERDYHLASKMKSMLIYPLLILFVVILVLALMVFFIIPQIGIVLQGNGQELPTITKISLGFSAFLRQWWWLIILGIFLLFFSITQYYRTEEGKKFFDRASLRLPIIGEFLKMIYLSRFAENLSTLISGGLPITQSLEITGEIVGNTAYKEVIFRTRDWVRKGEQISQVLADFPEIFPPVFVQMTLVGEKTGTLDSSLTHIVGFYKKEIDRTVDTFLNILEPALIVILGIIVAGLMFSVLMPLYDMIAI